MNRIQDFIDRHATMLLLVTDREGKIEKANPYAQQWVGQALVSRYFSEIVIDLSKRFRFQDLLDDPSTPHPLSIATAALHPQTLVFRLKDLGQRILIMGQHDVQEMEKLQKEILSLNKHLSNLTRELHQSNSQLARLNQLKNQFLGMAAHDLRKPVGVMMSFTQILLEELKPQMGDDHASLLGFIDRATQDMARLIDEFLDVSMIEAGRLELNLQHLHLVDVIDEALRYVRPLAAQRKVELNLHYSDNLPPMELDGPKLGQVICNLVSNAIEHSPTDAKVWIRCENDGPMVRLSVRDMGMGISEAKKKTMFQPFERAGTEKNHGERRIGLGLTIAQRIVEAHGGRIWIESKLNEGACFFVTLPSIPIRTGADHD